MFICYQLGRLLGQGWGESPSPLGFLGVSLGSLLTRCGPLCIFPSKMVAVTRERRIIQHSPCPTKYACAAGCFNVRVLTLLKGTVSRYEALTLHEKLALTIFDSHQRCSQSWTTIFDTRIKGVGALLTSALTQL